MKLKVLVTALALFVGTAVANANDAAWFSLEGSSDPTVTAAGGPGQTLVIDKPLGPGSIHLTIGYNFTNNKQFGAPAAMNAWGFALGPVDPMGGTQAVSFGNGNFANSQAGGYGTDVPNIDPAADFSAGAVSFNSAGGAGLVFTFDIWIEKFDSTVTWTYIFGDLDTQFASSGYAWFGSIGPNQGHYGIPGYNNQPGQLPLISIHNVPEPATIALLGLGVVALIRRRR